MPSYGSNRTNFHVPITLQKERRSPVKCDMAIEFLQNGGSLAPSTLLIARVLLLEPTEIVHSKTDSLRQLLYLINNLLHKQYLIFRLK